MEYKGIEESLKYLIKTVSDIKNDVDTIQAQIKLKTFTLKEIAEMLGCNAQSLRNDKWKMPNFGKADIGMQTRRWFHKTIVDWYSIPESDRKFQWESMSARERREALGIESKKTKTRSTAKAG